jgi:hypothetical protein
MLKINVIVCRKVRSIPKILVCGSKRKVYMSQVIVDAIVITKITAIPIPSAESNFLETPIYGHNPRNLIRTKLLIKIAPIIIAKKLAVSIVSLLMNQTFVA